MLSSICSRVASNKGFLLKTISGIVWFTNADHRRVVRLLAIDPIAAPISCIRDATPKDQAASCSFCQHPMHRQLARYTKASFAVY